MKRLFHFLGLSLVAMMMNSCYDDSALWDSLKEYEGELAQLKSLCTEINQNVSSLQNLITAVENGDMIKSVTPFTEGDKTGYLIEFLKTPSIKIYNGQQGATGAQGPQGPQGDKGDKGDPGQDVGSAPSLGVKQDTDGVYYWTLNGTWLLDDAGNKVKAVATDGNDGAQGPAGPAGETGPQGPAGVTPQLKIEDGYWYVSYDNGKEGTWQQLGKATGEDGKDASSSGDSIFASVREDATHVYFTLTDGTVFKLQKAAGSGLNIEFDVEQGAAIVPGTTLKVKYTVSGGDDNTLVRTIMSDGYLYSTIKPMDATTGYVYVWLSDDFDDEDMDEEFDNEVFPGLTERDFYESTLAVFVSVSDSKGNNIVKAINFVEGKVDAVQDAFLAEATKGTVTAKISTNVAKNSYTVSIPENAKSWLSYQPATKALTRVDELKFAVEANEGERFRSAPVSLKNEMGQVIGSFVIVQKSYNAEKVVEFADPAVEQACLSEFDADGNGSLTYAELALVTDVKDLFKEVSGITSFNEFQYFTSITVIPEEMFYGFDSMRSICLPESITRIEHSAFNGCSALSSIVLPEGLEYIGGSAFNYSGLSGVLQIPAGVKYLGWSAFSNTDITVVDMLPIAPPHDRYDESRPFDSETVIYVADESVKAYRSLYAYEDCNVLPRRMANLSLELDCDVLPGAVYVEDGFSFPLSVTVSGNLKEYPEVAEYGICYGFTRSWYGDEIDYSYIPVEKLGQKTDVNVRISDYRDYEYEEYGDSLAFMAKVGAYVRLSDDTMLRLDMRNIRLGYDMSPSVEFLSVGNAECSDDGRLCFELRYKASGMNFLDKERVLWQARVGDMTERFESYGFNDGELEGLYEVYISDLLEHAPVKVVLELYDYYRDRTISNAITFAVNADGTVEASIGEPAQVEALSIREFLEKENGSTSYELTGMITHIADYDKGNIVLSDGSGDLYVYGISDTPGSQADGSFRNLGLKVGDYLTIHAARSTYRELPQASHAYYVSHVSNEPGVVIPLLEITVAEFLNEEVSNTRVYLLEGRITEIVNDKYGNLYLSDEDGTSVYVYGVKESETGTNTSFANLGLQVGDLIRIKGFRSAHNSTPQMTEAYFVGKASAEDMSQYTASIQMFNQTGCYFYVNHDENQNYLYHDYELQVSADEELTAKAEEIGVYWLYGEGYNFSGSYPVRPDETTVGYFVFNTNMYNVDGQNYRASYEIKMGVYAKMADGNTYKFGEQPVVLYYDKKPKISYTFAQREFLSSEIQPLVEYEYDGEGNPTDSLTVDRQVNFYRDSINFTLEGGLWLNNYYTAFEYDSEDGKDVGYSFLDNEIGDGDWTWTPTRTVVPDYGLWQSEYFISWDGLMSGWMTSSNQLKSTWNDDGTCILTVSDEAPENDLVNSSSAQTKSMVRSRSSLDNSQPKWKFKNPKLEDLGRNKPFQKSEKILFK